MKNRALRGVNLGGWLVVEKWMTPSLFKGLDADDEYTLATTLEGRTRLLRHRHEFIQEEDFAWMSANGVELIRIPFGYWLFTEDDHYVGGREQLDWAMAMADKYNLKVLLDFHALPGSQNGKVHSGRAGAVRWFSGREHREVSRDVCRKVAKRYAHSPALWGVQVINEPVFGWLKQFMLLQYYRQVYRDLSATLPPSVYVVFSDAFRPWLLAGALRRTKKLNVAMDIHWYSWMVPLWGVKTLKQFFLRVKRHRYTIHGVQRVAHPVIVGEWNAVLPHALKPLVNDMTWREAALKHFSVQQEVYSYALAQCYWTYKTEQDGMWSYRYIVEKVLSDAPDGATLEI